MRRIVVLRKHDDADIWDYVLRASVPASRQVFYANPNATSANVNATQAEIDALKSGTEVERVDSISVPSGANPLQQAQAMLVDVWTAYQDHVTTYNPWQRYGTSWDGTSWTPEGVS